MVGARADVREKGPNPNNEYEESEHEGTVDEEQVESEAEQNYPLTEPHHPHPKFIEVQKLANKTLRFQKSWFNDFPWLHYCPRLKGVLCFYCTKAFSKQTSSLAKNTEPTFILTGFRNWKRAVEGFERHSSSKTHNIAVTTHIYEPKSINAQLSSVLATAQEEARSNLLKILSSVKYLAQQGLALRGHGNEEGNFHYLLLLKAEDDPALGHWLKRNHSYTSPVVQNEMLSLMSNTIIRNIAEEILALPVVQYSVIIDGTQDVSGTEQESICLRYVDSDLEPREEFIGLYETSSTTGEQISKIVSDVLLRLNLPLSGLRGQTYDGAANMSGHLSGVQAHIRKEQPLAIYVHCGPHCVNLVTQAACSTTPIVRDALQWTHELGCLFGQSGKFKTIFKSVAKSTSGSYITLKPLCPTRWTVRTPAIDAILGQYEAVLAALEEMASSNTSDTASRANGLHERFQKGTTVLGLFLAKEVMMGLEGLNTSLQGRGKTVGGMLSAVACVKKHFQSQRTEEAFITVYTSETDLVTSLDIEPIKMPHLRKPQRRHAGPAEPYVPSTDQEYYRVQFFQVLDIVTTQLTKRFEQEGLQHLVKLEKVLLCGQVDDVVDLYPELQFQSLKVQLAMFTANYTYKTCSEVTEIMRNMVPEVRGLFSQVEALLRLLLVVPVSSAEAERSFSALRRLKTWLRSSMSQTRLNSVAVCHVHRERMYNLDKKKLCQEFVQVTDRRMHVFGSF